MRFITVSIEFDNTGPQGVYAKLMDRLTSGEADGYRVVSFVPYGDLGIADMRGVHVLLEEESASQDRV